MRLKWDNIYGQVLQTLRHYINVNHSYHYIFYSISRAQLFGGDILQLIFIYYEPLHWPFHNLQFQFTKNWSILWFHVLQHHQKFKSYQMKFNYLLSILCHWNIRSTQFILLIKNKHVLNCTWNESCYVCKHLPWAKCLLKK